MPKNRRSVSFLSLRISCFFALASWIDPFIFDIFLVISLATIDGPILLCFAKNTITLSLLSYTLIFDTETEFWTIIPMKDPIIKWRSRVERFDANEFTMNFKKLRDSRYISVFSSYKSYLTSIDKGSNISLALFASICTPTIFLLTTFLISRMASRRFFGFGSLRVYKCSSIPSNTFLRFD